MESVFHSGEEAIQQLLGVSEEAHELEGLIKDRLPPVAMRLLPAFNFVMATSIDHDGNVWTSFLTGPPKFITVLSDRVIALSMGEEDLFLSNIKQNKDVGLLFINFEARARLRVNGQVEIKTDQLLITIKESYFNCPKYIQGRKIVSTHQNHGVRGSNEASLDDAQRKMISQADTFFISTYVAHRGADCSHRGGNPGFIEVVDHQTIQWLDYPGNNLYNTLGNLYLNPNCGLLFIDFTNNRILQLSGTAQFVIHEDDARYIVFKLKFIREIVDATPFNWKFIGYSEYNVKR